MIALMQEDTRIDRDEGGKNLSIGYFIMKVLCLLFLLLQRKQETFEHRPSRSSCTSFFRWKRIVPTGYIQ